MDLKYSALLYAVAFIYISQLYFFAGHEGPKQVQRQMPRGQKMLFPSMCLRILRLTKGKT